MTKLRLVFFDGDESSADVCQGETLLAAAKRSGIKLASDCEMGDCQTCRARIVAGDVTHDPDTILSLSDDEVASGEVLLCVATAHADVTVQLPYERASLLPARNVSLQVQAIEQLCDSVVRLTARVAERITLTFLPGQYLNLRVPGTDQWRSYSMANAPNETGALEFLVRILDQGAMSEFLTRRAAPGDMIDSQGPFGRFYLRKSEATQPMLMIAGGTGLAPMAAMLRMMKTRGDRRSIVLCFGVTRKQDMFYLEEIQALCGGLPGLDVRTAVMIGNAAQHASGTAVDLVRPADVVDRDIYLCGPPAMTDHARKAVDRHGATSARIFAERFMLAGDNKPYAL